MYLLHYTSDDALHSGGGSLLISPHTLQRLEISAGLFLNGVINASLSGVQTEVSFLEGGQRIWSSRKTLLRIEFVA